MHSSRKFQILWTYLQRSIQKSWTGPLYRQASWFKRHTQWNKMVFPIFYVFQLNLHMISEPNVSFQSHIQIGKFMKWNYMTSSWNYKVHVDHSTHETLQYELQWPVYWNLRTHFIILALDSVEKVKKNRSILTAIIKSIKFCVRNGIAVRAHRDDGA